MLLPVPEQRYDVPRWTTAKVARDHHIQVGKALYSVPGDLIGTRVTVRVDSALVKILSRGQVVKIHPALPPGRRSTDEADLPSEVTVYAMRDIGKLTAMAARHGDAIGTYAAALLDTPLPWTKMRSVYRLLGLVKKFGGDWVNTACVRALECEAIDVGLIVRMVARAAEVDPPELAVLQDHHQRIAAHLADDHDIHRGGGGGQMTYWHDYVHWLACTPTHDLWPTTGQETPR